MTAKKFILSEAEVIKQKEIENKTKKKLFDKEIIDKKYIFKKIYFYSIFTLSLSLINLIIILINFTNENTLNKTKEHKNSDYNDIYKFNLDSLDNDISFHFRICMQDFLLLKALLAKTQSNILYSIFFILIIQLFSLILLIFIEKNLLKFKKYIILLNSYISFFNFLYQFQIMIYICDFNDLLFLKAYFVNYLKVFILVFWILKIENNYIIITLGFLSNMLLCYINNLFYDFHNNKLKYLIFLLYLLSIIFLSVLSQRKFFKDYTRLKKLNSKNKSFMNLIDQLDVPIVIFKKNSSIFYNNIKYLDQIKISFSSAIQEIDEVFLKISIFSNIENFNQNLDRVIVELIREFQEILSELNVYFLIDEINEIPEKYKLILENSFKDLLNYLFSLFKENEFIFIGTRMPHNFFSLKNDLKIQKIYMRINPISGFLEIILKSIEPNSSFDDTIAFNKKFQNKNELNDIINIDDHEYKIHKNISHFKSSRNNVSSCFNTNRYNEKLDEQNTKKNNSKHFFNTNRNTFNSNKNNSINDSPKKNINYNNEYNFDQNGFELRNSENFLHKIFSNILRKICHEIRNPLLNIIEITKKTKNEINSLDKNLLEKIKSIKYICHLINFTILDFEYLNTILNSSNYTDLLIQFRKVFESNESEHDLFKEANYMKKIFLNKINISNKIIAIDLSIDTDVQRKIKLRFDTINYLLYIIILNSIKFSLNGTIEIKISTNKKTENLIMIVSDEGIGIKEDYMPKIGQQFYKAENSSNNYGLGIGLFIAKTLIESMFGCLTVESKFGFGTTVTIQIPLQSKQGKDYRLLLNNLTIKSEKLGSQSNKTFSSISNLSKYNEKWGTSRTLSKTKVILTNNSRNLSLKHSDSIGYLTERKTIMSKQTLPKKRSIYKNSLESASKMTSTITNKDDMVLAINYKDFINFKSQKSNKNVGSPISKYDKSDFVKDSGMINIYNINLSNSSSVNFRNINLNNNVINHNANNSISNCNISQNSNNIEGQNTNTNQISYLQRENLNFDRKEDICRILIVDDEEFIRKSQINVIKKFLKKLNVKPEFEECSDGIECLYKLYYNLKIGIKFQIIFTDETMDFMKGSSMCKIVKEFIKENILYDIKISMVTSYEKNFMEKSDMRNYIDHITTKPLSVNAVENIFFKLFN